MLGIEQAGVIVVLVCHQTGVAHTKEAEAGFTVEEWIIDGKKSILSVAGVKCEMVYCICQSVVVIIVVIQIRDQVIVVIVRFASRGTGVGSVVDLIRVGIAIQVIVNLRIVGAGTIDVINRV